jgi:hypothetical protein
MADNVDAELSRESQPDGNNNAINNVLPFVRPCSDRAALEHDGNGVDDDELLQRALSQIKAWKSGPNPPSLTSVQQLFHKLICDCGSRMLRDKVVDAIIAAFNTELGGKRALGGTWTQIEKDVATERAQAAREGLDDECPPLTAEQKAVLRDDLWPKVCELAQAPDLLERVVRQVQSMGVVNERELITLIYLAATSRVLDQPINPVVKGTSSGGKSYTTKHTLRLFPPESVNHLASSSALALVYDDRPLANTVLFVQEANQLQADENNMFSMLLRSLISEGRIVHQTTVEDPDSRTGRRVERIVREGPIALIITTTGELHAENETRMLSFHISESQEQTRAVIEGLAARAAGTDEGAADFAIWHDFQRWIALGPTAAVILFAPQIAAKIPPSMVRFRRDVESLFNFIKASAILHQEQRKVDDKGRVVATLDDYRVAYSIFSKVLAETSGQRVTENVRAVVDLIAQRAAQPAAKPNDSRFARVAGPAASSEVVLSSEQIGTLTGIGKSAAYRAIRSAIDLGFLVNNEARPRKPYRLVVQQHIDDAAATLLPHPDTLSTEGGVL